MVFPAPEDDPDPLEGERSNNSIVRFSFRLLLLIVGPGPEGVSNRQPGPFNKRLSQESRTTVAPVGPMLLTTCLDDGSDTAVLLKFTGRLITRPIRAKGNQ